MAKAQTNKVKRKQTIANNSAVEDHAIFSLPINLFLQNSNAGILLTDALHRFIWCNNVFLRDADTDASAIIGQPFKDVMSHMATLMQNPEDFISRMEELRKKKKPCQGLELILTDNRIYE